MSKKSVYVQKIPFNEDSVKKFRKDIIESGGLTEKYFLNYPIVYIAKHNNKEKYLVYVGESSDIVKRTLQHLIVDSKERDDWKALAESSDSEMYIIGHELFNKSLTLDIENRLMLYLSSVDDIECVYNRRTNQQNEYYTSEHLDKVFSGIWRTLRRYDKKLFPLETIIRDSAIFKASPFHKLTIEQSDAISQIKVKIIEALKENQTGKLIFVSGAAGAGKTVLLSSLFYDICHTIYDEEGETIFDNLDNYLLVNHNQQLTIYQQIAVKLNLMNSNKVTKPTSFINDYNINMADVVLIDEAHLLWTQGKQSYRGKNQLLDILNKAKVVVAVFDEDQILATNQIWEKSLKEKIVDEFNPEIIYLNNQLRIQSSLETHRWIRNIIDHQIINNIPDDSNYEIKIFEHPKDLEIAIREKASDVKNGISRIISTFDWEYNGNRKPETQDYWMVEENDWSMPWNLQLKESDRIQKKKNNQLSWGEMPHTINEVGSTYTVQGLDLNYAGLIIGPSVKYRDGKVIFDPNESKNKNAIQNRMMSDGTKMKHGETLLKNELNVLITRGVHGLYIYAVDKELREALLKARKGILDE